MESDGICTIFGKNALFLVRQSCWFNQSDIIDKLLTIPVLYLEFGLGSCVVDFTDFSPKLQDLRFN